MSILALALAMLLLLWVGVLLVFVAPLAARWREPVLRHPVLILESDDWGAGPLNQTDALKQLAALLQRMRDRSGRPAVMTLGAILEVPDCSRIAATGCAEYHGLPLADACFEGVRAAMKDGIHSGVFAPQLHGQCHYWPSALLTAAQHDPAVHNWLTGTGPPSTEALPSPLQSRWVDASSLPSCALALEAIRQAVAAEAADYQAIFGSTPQVAVATTFVWNDDVEAAWAKVGVEVVITPGRRATCRNAAGQPACVDATMLTGEHSLAGQIYLVRDVYYEPALGHAPQRLVDGLLERARQGRACLVEIHRFNFMQALEASLATLEAGLNSALSACPDLRFITPIELAHAIRDHDPDWVETGLMPRLSAWRARLDEVPRFRRVAQLTGLALPLTLLGRAT